jgi:tRNA pseudouridine38-40 synthase
MEPSSQRFITEFSMSEPFERDGLEFAIIKIKGQSFMLHQIRKMIGMCIAIVRGHASIQVLEDTFKVDKIDVPRAPGLGLMLEEVHYDKYNQRFGEDGIHKPLSWDHVSDSVERFKEDMIQADIISTEKSERSMLEWMKCLPIHTFEPRHFESSEKEVSPLKEANKLLNREHRLKILSDDE